MRYGILKKISATTLAAVMAVSLVPTVGVVTNGALGQVAAKAAEVDSGTCGENLTWSLDDSGTLTISGSGDMLDYNMEEEPYDPAPWYDYCENIKAIQIKEGVTGIGQDAFCDCKYVTDFTIPESITSIRDYAFYDCDNLTEIVIPAAVTEIGDYAFDKCSGIKTIKVSGENTMYDSREDCNAIIEKKGNQLIRGCQNTVIPDGVEVSFYAFNGCDQARVLINSGFNNIIETNVKKASDGCVMLGLTGEYIVDQDAVQAVLDRINAIRKEACDNGYPNPETMEPLTPEDYVKIKWSEDLEYIARIRAAEASLNIIGLRPNKDETFSISSPNNEKSHGEIRSWNYLEEVLSAIDGDEGWYSEKQYWNTSNPDPELAGNYTQIINPRNKYIGLGAFLSPHTFYKNCTVGEFSYESNLEEKPMDLAEKCIQKIEVSCEFISNQVILGMLEGESGDSEQLSVAVDLDFSNEEFEYNTVEQLHVMDDITWTSSDPSIVSVDADGTAQANAPGEATITARFGGLEATAKYVVKESEASSIEQADITGIIGKPYIGEAVTQSPEVKLGDKMLKEDVDYRVAYANNTKVGTATITFTGIGNYTGSIQKTFKILPLFKDVEVGHKFFDPIYWMAGEGYTSGWADNTFRPWNTCNRAACVTFLWRMAGKPEPTVMAKFNDMTDNAEFNKAISWAAEEGITTGYSGNVFKPWATCNRAAIMTFIWRYAGKPEASTSSFTDPTGNVDFDTAIAWASENGIATGFTEEDGSNTFRPWTDCNRAAISAFLYRFGK